MKFSVPFRDHRFGFPCATWSCWFGYLEKVTKHLPYDMVVNNGDDLPSDRIRKKSPTKQTLDYSRMWSLNFLCDEDSFEIPAIVIPSKIFHRNFHLRCMVMRPKNTEKNWGKMGHVSTKDFLLIVGLPMNFEVFWVNSLTNDLCKDGAALLVAEKTERLLGVWWAWNKSSGSIWKETESKSTVSTMLNLKY